MPDPLIYANLLHLSYNMWGDWDRPGAGKFWTARPYLRFDQKLWDDLLAAMQPYQGGGEMIDTVTLDGITYNEPPHRFEAGTPPIVQAIGLGAAVDYIEAIGRDQIAAHEHEIAAYAAERLKRINSLRLIGNAPGKGGIFSFELEGAHAHDVSTILDRYGIAVRAGTHCAMPLLKRFGVTSTCRASLALYSGKDDIDALAEGIEKAREFFG